MRLIIAIEIKEGESFSAETPFSESDLNKRPGQLADQFASPMFKAILAAFEEPLPGTHKERMKVLDHSVKRSVEALRSNQAREKALAS